jgi:hypothetical protein
MAHGNILKTADTMGKEKSLAASVPWSQISSAIAMNPTAAVGIPVKTAAATLLSLPPDEPVPWFPKGWIEDTTCSIGDIVSFSLWIRDPMYRTATLSVRKTMEMEEAATLLHSIDTAWKENKTRGWIRKHLEEDLRERSAGAAAPPDVWESVRTVRRAALLADFVCSQRGFRVALWWPEYKSASCIPVVAPADLPIYNLDCKTGRIIVGPAGAAVPAVEWPKLLDVKDFTWTPPACVPSIGTLTVAAIHELIVAMEPTAPKTGGRVGLWNRYQWLRFLQSLVVAP